MAREHPGEIDALVDKLCEANDLPLRVKILAGGQDSAEQERCIDGRNLALPSTFARLLIHQVIKPAVFLMGPRGEKAQGRADTLARVLRIYPAALGGDAKGREAEARGGAARDAIAGLALCVSPAVGVR